MSASFCQTGEELLRLNRIADGLVGLAADGATIFAFDDVVAQVYGLRWRMETICKAWKSHFGITAVPKGSPTQLLAVTYARLIFLPVMIPFCTSRWQEAGRSRLLPPRSLLKTAALLGDFKKYDLEERLLDFAGSIVRLVEQMPKKPSANHLGGHLLRSGTSPLLNHGEAQAAQSKSDFIHKLKVCLKEHESPSEHWL